MRVWGNTFHVFLGDLSNAESIMDFLASPEALDLPDHIEEVGGKQLEALIEERTFVAVFFCKLSI